MMDMQTLIKDGTLPLVKTTPGAYLGSCRYKLPEDLGGSGVSGTFHQI